MPTKANANTIRPTIPYARQPLALSLIFCNITSLYIKSGDNTNQEDLRGLIDLAETPPSTRKQATYNTLNNIDFVVVNSLKTYLNSL